MDKFCVLEAFILLRREVALLRAAHAKHLDLGHNQVSVLCKLSLSNATMGELAEHTLSDKASMTRTVSVLEKSGFVKRVPDKHDCRIIRIELTPEGKKQACKAHEIRRSIGKALDFCLSPAERKQFLVSAQKIVKKINETKN